MRNELHITQLGTPVNNRVLVEVIDNFQEFMSKGGVWLSNCAHEEAWADSEAANITEFVPRHGVVVGLPAEITRGSFDYDTECEVTVGDTVYWSSISFKEHIPLVLNDKKYLLVDYHDLLLKIKGEDIVPINGYTLLLPVKREETVLAYTRQINVTERWKVAYKPERLNTELINKNKFEDVWKLGDVVYILILDKPYKLEGFIEKALKEPLYAVPTRMILCSDEED